MPPLLAEPIVETFPVRADTRAGSGFQHALVLGSKRAVFFPEPQGCRKHEFRCACAVKALEYALAACHINQKRCAKSFQGLWIRRDQPRVRIRGAEEIVLTVADAFGGRQGRGPALLHFRDCGADEEFRLLWYFVAVRGRGLRDGV